MKANFKHGINHLRNRKIKGGALYVSIIVSLVVSILLMALLLISFLNQRKLTNIGSLSQLNLNLKSGLEIAKSNYFNEAINNKWFVLDEEDTDSLKINKLNWGAFNIVSVTTKNLHHQLSISGLYGTHMSIDTGLLISNNGRPIGMAGNIVFKSNCYLPDGGIKPAFIEGLSYIANPITTAHIKKSSFQVPIPHTSFINNLKNQINSRNDYMDSIVTGLNGRFENKFDKKTILLSYGVQQIANCNWSGNIKIMSANEVIIDSSAKLNDVLIVAKKVKFKEGFKGVVHVICTDSIVTGKNNYFAYPSSFSVFNSTNKSLGAILLNENVMFYGSIVTIAESDDCKTLIKLHSKSEVNGLVYSSHYLHLEGILNANVYANSLLLSTPSAVYENHILSCEINPKAIADVLAVPDIFKADNALIKCKQFN
ncbi:MAG: hypothetical protein IM600_14580 [Bacteroidetes bacterium]|nr:hypothetical protein [Bacteroidota bacterium]MCA6444656.1 hypothetical protein [Bacteroidota bacterium]